MSEIKTNILGMKNTAQDEVALGRELNQLEGDINSILSALAIRSSAAESIRRALRTSIQNVSDARVKLNILSSALNDIIQLYQATENKIIGEIGGQKLDEKIKDAVYKTLDKIKDIAYRCGMNQVVTYSSDPVNLSNGNYVYEKKCMELDTEMSMQFRIFYNIQNEAIGSLGRGWMHTWEICLEHQENRIDMILDDASRYVFMLENDFYQPAPGTTAVFKHRDEFDVVTDKNGVSYFFETSGRLVKMENLNGCYIILVYDNGERLSRVMDRRGNYFLFHYDDKNHLKIVEDVSGRKVILDWSGDQLSMVSDSQGRTTSYHYDTRGWLTELVNGRGITCLVNTYDDEGRTVSQKFPDGGEMTYQYLDDKNQVVLREQNGNEIIYEHDELWRNTRTIYADGEEINTFDQNNNRTSVTDKRGNISRYSYDNKGNLVGFRNAMGDELAFSYTTHNQITQVLLNGKMLQQAEYNEKHLQTKTENANGAVDRYEYDEYGQPVVWIRADGSRIELTYDERGNLSSITNSVGGCTRYCYNDRNQVVKTIDPLGNETSYAYNDADELTMVRDAAGSIQTYEYDECGNIIRITDASGAETVTAYNEMNKPICVTESDGAETLYEYDTMWNVVSVIAPDGGKTNYEYDKLHRIVSVTDANGGINRMEYDACGNLIQRIDPDGGVHRLKYDVLNRPNYVCDPVGMEVRAEYDALGNVTTVLYSDGSVELYDYDLLGNMTMAQDRSGYQKYYEYDILGNLKTVFDATGVLEEYSYYQGGLLKAERHVDGSSREFYYDENENVIGIINQDGNQWKFSYDCLGRVIKAVQDYGMEESYEYDALGNITAVIDGNGIKTSYKYKKNEITSVIDGLGNETHFKYDICNRLTQVIQSEQGHIDVEKINAFNRNQQDIRVTSYHYDKNGNIVEVVDPEGNQTIYTYDGNNRILTQTDADGNKTSCEYRLDGTVNKYLFADGKSIKLSYNSLKQLIQMEDWLGITRIQPDKVGRPEEVTAPSGDSILYEWGERGECKSLVYPDGSKVSYEYDDALRLLECRVGGENVSYQYYPDGKLKEKLLPEQIKTCYQYNQTGYISEISHVKNEEIIDKLSYHYDKNNRKNQITRMRHGMEENGIYEYQYNETGNLISVLKNGSEEEKYDYDAYGNRTFSRIRGEETRYTYNRLNQLTTAKDSIGEHTYSYDRRGNLLQEQVNGVIKNSLKFNAQGLIESVVQVEKTITYQYNGFGDQVMRCIVGDGHIYGETRYTYDITKSYNHLLCVTEGDTARNMIWDGGILAFTGAQNTQYLLNDERMSPLRIIEEGNVCGSVSFDSFGNVLEDVGIGMMPLGYAGYRPDSSSGFLHVNARDYDTKNGRFISRDRFAGMIMLPLTLNAYSYAMGDPINRYDPTGMIAAWLGAGIVGAVVKVTSKIAGDIVESVATGKIHVSSWQSYVGAATGGFTYGTVYVASGGNKIIAGAASEAVETLTTEGLSMLTKAKGYRAEDGYTWKNLLVNTGVSAATGAGTSYLFGKAADKIKIPGINMGKGSYQAAFKQVVTKAANRQIANMSLKTLGKGIIAYGGVHLLDEVYKKGKKKAKEYVGNQITNLISGKCGSAQCPAEG